MSRLLKDLFLKDLLLKDLRCFDGHREHAKADLRIGRGRILELGTGLEPKSRDTVIDAGAFCAFPGLINSHDHLGLDVFPPLGAGPYANFRDWVEEVYDPDASPIRELQQVPLRDRLFWGAYRNLIGGVTTVAHHDPYYRRVFGRQWLGRHLVRRRQWGLEYPIRVLRRFTWSHSLAGMELGYGPAPRDAFRRSRDRPFMLHAAEGTDERAAQEIDRLDELGILGPRTVLIHAIALSPEQRRLLGQRGAGVVWCPATHRRLYADTTAVGDLPPEVRVGLGTDSTLTGAPTLLDELRQAARTGRVDVDRLAAMVTHEGAALLGLDDGRGTLRPGAPADLLLIPNGPQSAAELLLQSRPGDPALVLIGGRPRLASPPLARRLGLGEANCRVSGRPMWIYGDPARLRRRLQDQIGIDLLSRNPVAGLLQEP